MSASSALHRSDSPDRTTAEIAADLMVSFIIVNWNAKDFLRGCLKSLESVRQQLPSEVIVVDNNSSDGSPDMLAEEFPDVTVIQTGANLGFAKGNNIGIKASRGRYLCLLNSDVETSLDTVQALCRLMDSDPEIGLAGPQVLNADGTVQFSCRKAPTLWNTVCRALSLDTSFPNCRILSEGLMLIPPGDHPASVEVLTGCFWFVRRDAISAVGGLDERFFMYGEDLDWCRRFRNCGRKIVYLPVARVVHYGGASSADAPVRFFVEMHRSQLQYWRKHHGVGTTLLLLVTFSAHNVFRIASYGVRCLVDRPGGNSALKVARSWECLKWLARNGWSYLTDAESTRIANPVTVSRS